MKGINPMYNIDKKYKLSYFFKKIPNKIEEGKGGETGIRKQVMLNHTYWRHALKQKTIKK